MGKCVIDYNDDDTGWIYCPNVGAAIAFTVFFGLCTLVHIVQAFNFRKKFCWVIIMSGIWETAGFAFRIVSAQKIHGIWHFNLQQILIILAPLWLNAFVYMTLGRMVHFFLPEKKIFGINARRLTLLFVLLDVTSFFVQASSSSMMSSDSTDTVKIGIDIYMGGVGLQEFFIIIFFFLAGRFQKKMTEHERTFGPAPYRWRPLLYTLYASLILITIRIIFRLVEFSGGIHGKVATSEAAFYCLDALPMIVAIALFNVVHPGRTLVGPESEFPKKEKKKKKRKDKKNKSMSVSDDSGVGNDAEAKKKRSFFWTRKRAEKPRDIESPGSETNAVLLQNR